jgi:putative redox protein
MKTEKISFENTQGDRLSAYIDLPAENPRAFALFAHCFTCNKNYKAFWNISSSLTEAGIGLLRFDFTGLGESGGDFSDTSFSSNTEDLVAAARMMEDRFTPPAILIGHSLGGAAVLQAAGDIPSSRAVVTVAAPSEPSHINRLLGLSAEKMGEEETRTITIAGRSFRVKRRFVEDLDRTNMRETIRGLKRALLVLHSPQDRVVGVENAADIFKSALHPKSYVSLNRADHLLTDPRDAAYAGAVIAVWAGRYLDQSEER